MKAWLTKARALHALGVSNLVRVASYRGRLRLGIHPVQRLRGAVRPGPLFKPVEAPPRGVTPSEEWGASGSLFGWHAIPADRPPSWNTDLLTKLVRAGSDVPWSRLTDFAGDDIKTIWEPSRLNWMVAFAQRARNGEPGALARLEAWMRDWIDGNPPYLGHNWKCAQEASIRLLHLAIAAVVLDQDRGMSDALGDLLHVHLARIMPTLGYAAAQDNNHATSEAAALYIGGCWLERVGDPRGSRFATLGRHQLERSVARLFAPDGSFSQHSITYHRLALDTLSIAELWRQRSGDASFATIVGRRAGAAADWLRHMVDDCSGDAPNIGANDGADLLQLGAAYRDFRPSVQLATALFGGVRAYPPGPWDDACAWLGVDLPQTVAPPPGSRRFDDGGYAVLRDAGAMAVMRYPRFRFRPGHADPLHVDLWVDCLNLLRDGGTYSYNCDAATMNYFSGIEAHNSVQFDDAEPMPRVGRFLFGDWLTTETRSDIVGNRFGASYRDRAGHRHEREITLLDGRLRVIDHIDGFKRSAVLRWRLAPGAWSLTDDGVTDGRFTIRLVPAQAMAMRLSAGSESRHYLHQSDLFVLEAEIGAPGIVTTEIDWLP